MEGDLPWSIASLDHRAGASALRRGAGPKARLNAGGGLGVHCPPLRSGLFTPSPLGWTGLPGPRRRAMTRDLWSDWASERGPVSISVAVSAVIPQHRDCQCGQGLPMTRGPPCPLD